MATMTVAKAREIVADAAVEDAPMSKKVAQAVITLAEDYGRRVNGTLVASKWMKNRWEVTLTVDYRRKDEEGHEVWGSIETVNIAYPYGWTDLNAAWEQAYEETGSWIG